LRKFVSIFLLLLISFTQIGYYALSSLQQYWAREDMETQLLASIPENNFTVFELSTINGDIRWEEQGKEFYLLGELYDIAKTKTIGKHTWLYCLSDKKEAQLLKARADAVKSGAEQNSGNKQASHTIKFQMTDCVIFERQNELIHTVYTGALHPEYAEPILFSAKQINTPPPKFYI